MTLDLVSKNPFLLVVLGDFNAKLSQRCHYQIIYAKFNLEAFHPPPYTREVWHYQYANVDLIRRSINQFDWDRTLANKRVDGKVFVFNKIVLHIPSNFVPHEVIG